MSARVCLVLTVAALTSSCAAAPTTVSTPASPAPTPEAERAATMKRIDEWRTARDTTGVWLVPVFYGTNRNQLNTEKRSYGTELAELQFGMAKVSIPILRHREGELERPFSLFGVKIGKLDPQRHFTVVDIQPMSRQVWLLTAGYGLQREKGEAFVYIHGFNNSFEDAALKAAQLAYDLNLDEEGVFMFSWPSKNSIAAYSSDEETARISVDPLAAFLRMVLDSTGAKRVTIVSHSLGSRLLASVLADFAVRPPRGRPAQIVFAAPDINVEEFRTNIAPRILNRTTHLSVYTSTGDHVLPRSEARHDYPRLGEGGPAVFRLEGFDKIDASNVDLDVLGHGYFATSKQVIDDLQLLLRMGLPAPSRNLRVVVGYPSTWRLP